MRLRIRYALSAVLVVAWLVGACGGGADGGGNEGVQVATSLQIFADMAHNVAGERAGVRAVLPSGADPHTYELPPDRVADIARADVVFVNGLGLEGNLLDVVDENAGGQVVELAEGLETPDRNPHLWLDVTNAQRYVERMRDALVQADPEGRAAYEANAEAYLRELSALDAEMEAAVQTIPLERRKLVTFHNAFPYLARRYGMDVVAVVVPSPGQEPSAQAVAELTETIQSEGVPAVYKEPQFSARILELAAGDAGVRVLDLLSDAYTQDVNSYADLMRFNAAQLKEGLRGG